jgi:hypothetical protein
MNYDYTKTRDVMGISTADCRVRYVVRSIQPCPNESSAHSQHASRDVLKTESAPFLEGTTNHHSLKAIVTAAIEC